MTAHPSSMAEGRGIRWNSTEWERLDAEFGELLARPNV